MEIQTELPNKEESFWTKYNKSQTKEKVLFVRLLKELCDTLPKKYRTHGRKPLELSHVIFCLCMKNYCLKSGRRIIGELELCKQAKLIEKIPHFNSLFNFLKKNDLTFVLEELIKLTSLPLKSIEKKFCCDSSGFGNAVIHDRWSAIRSNYEKHHKYFKAHITFGVLTNIVTSCKITDGNQNDSPMLSGMVDETAENFKIEEWSADKGYLSRENLQKIWDKGGLPLIPFKENTTPKRGYLIWTEMYNFFKKNNDLFMKKYHLRSNAESGFHSIKAKFGDLTQMRNETGAKNDVLVKILCYNLCCLIQELFNLNLEFSFAQLRKEIAQH
ncbi:MAG: transposase [Nanoarchaeota archaeon]